MRAPLFGKAAAPGIGQMIGVGSPGSAPGSSISSGGVMTMVKPPASSGLIVTVSDGATSPRPPVFNHSKNASTAPPGR
jgi:hypothetical protein